MSYTYTAHRTLVVDKEFRCGGCGLRAPVKVEATGAGQESGVSGRGNQLAAASVNRQATEGALRFAQVFLELAPCPKCRWRDPEKVAGFKRRNWMVGVGSVGVLAVGVLVALLAALVDAVPGLVGAFGGLIAFLGLLGVIITPLMALATWKNAARKVHFPVENAAAGGSIGA